MEHVHVRNLCAGRRETVEQVPRFNQRRVERLAVEGDERPGPREILCHVGQHPSLGRIVGHQVLLDNEGTILVEPRTADEESMRPGASAEPRRLKVEENERHARHAGREQRGAVLRRLKANGEISDARAPVRRVGLEAAHDHERTPAVAAAPLAAEYLFQRAAGADARRLTRGHLCGLQVLVAAGFSRPNAVRRLRRTRHGPAPGRPDDAAEPVPQFPRVHRHAASRSDRSRPRMRSAAALASGPVLPTGPTQPGQPFPQGHSAISRSVAASSSSCIR